MATLQSEKLLWGEQYGGGQQQQRIIFKRNMAGRGAALQYQRQGNGKCRIKGNQTQQTTVSIPGSRSRTKTCSPMDKKLVLRKNYSASNFSRKTLHRVMENVSQRPKHTIFGARLQNRFSGSTSSGKFFKYSSYESGAEEPGRDRNRWNVEGGYHSQQSNQPIEVGFLSNLFLVEKKDGDNRPVINLKSRNNFIPYKHFKMGGLRCLKDLLKKGTSCENWT